MICKFCKTAETNNLTCDDCRIRIQEFAIDRGGFSFLAVMLSCIDLQHLAEIVRLATERAQAGRLPQVRSQSELAVEAEKALSKASSDHLEGLRRLARDLGVCMDCKVPGSIPVGGRPIAGPSGATFYAAKCEACTKRGSEAYKRMLAERKRVEHA
jgi:hypothetical protein